MSAYLPDLKSTTVSGPSIYPGAAVTATGTGAAVDLIEGDGNVNAFFHIGTGTGSTGPAGITGRVLGTAAGGTAGGTYTVLGTFAFGGTTGGTGLLWASPVQRPGRYVKLDMVIAGTAASFINVFGGVIEQRKFTGTVPT